MTGTDEELSVGGSRTRPRVVITGASGFLGRQLLRRMQDDYRIYGIARRSQHRSGAVEHPNIGWDLVDIGNRERLMAVFERIAADGPVDAVIHLAAYYDFTGEDHPEYWRTNVEGMRNVLDASRLVEPQRFIFASSVAACSFPPSGVAITENTPPNGREPYSVSKRLGEEMLREYAGEFPSTIVRFAAMFSDWCEYPPLFVFLQTWLSRSWNRRVLGGRGGFGVPYLHVADGVRCVLRVLDRIRSLPSGQVVQASTSGATPVAELFEAATAYVHGEPESHLYLPRGVCALGMAGRDLLGRLTGERPFERAWMAHYIDRQLTVDATATYELLDWQPRERLQIVRRLPFLIENSHLSPLTWHRRNEAALRHEDLSVNLRVHGLLERHEEGIVEQLYSRIAADPERFPSYNRLTADELKMKHRTALRSLMSAVLTKERSVYVLFCRDLAERRYRQGFGRAEVCGALRLMRESCLEAISGDPDARELREAVESLVGGTLLFGCDQLEDFFDSVEDPSDRVCPWPGVVAGEETLSGVTIR